MRRLLSRMFTPVIDFVLRFIKVDDPWERHSAAAPTSAFGSGSTHNFRWYFEGESQAPVKSIDEICDWLMECKYISDEKLFNEGDFWQHPNTFEWLRRGDCEDHALWAWRKLVELGVDAEFVSGRWSAGGKNFGGHAWVIFKKDNKDFVLETVCKTRGAMIRPLADVRTHYRPHFAVNANFETISFSGWMVSRKERK